MHNDYTELRGRLQRSGVFERQLGYYAGQTVVMVALLLASFGVLFVTHSFWVRMLDSALMAIVFIQLGFILHDAGHRQLFQRSRLDDGVMLVIGAVIGFSRSWWFDSHNSHHARPNDLVLDPNTELYVVNFTEGQARDRTSVWGRLTRFQAYYFFPMMAIEGIGAHIVSIVFLARGKARYRLIEAAGMALHIAVYVGLLLALMPAWQALLFMLIHHALAGLYMGSVFAPNHKGMLVPDAACGLDYFERQVLTSRNIMPSALVDCWFGGLNYQIEHHLFPMIPRNKLKSTRLIVKAFCKERGIPYHETGVLQSYTEIARYLHQVVSPLRAVAET